MHLSGAFVAAMAIGVAMPSAAQEVHPKHWGYTGEVGPDHWQQFGSDFGACHDGKNQSPVDLSRFIEAQLPPIAFDYAPGGHQVVNNGHAIQVDYAPGSRITVDGTDFALKQFHFHSPSENTIDGKSFPMEAHFVHSDAKGNLAVVALLFEEGASNQVLEQVWPLVPKDEDDKAEIAPAVAAADLIGRGAVGRHLLGGRLEDGAGVVADHPVGVVEAEVQVEELALDAFLVDQERVVVIALDVDDEEVLAREQDVATEQVGAPVRVVHLGEVDLLDHVVGIVDDEEGRVPVVAVIGLDDATRRGGCERE